MQKRRGLGEWQPYDYDIGGFRNTGYSCSNCNKEFAYDPVGSNGILRYKYCPNCRAEMKVKNNNRNTKMSAKK